MNTYNRILLKLSGEALMGNQKYGIDTNRLQDYALEIKTIMDKDVQLSIVIGGGNIFRGLSGVGKGFDRVKGDSMGMLATIINSLALESALQLAGLKAKTLTSIRMEPIGELYVKDKALQYMKEGFVVIIAGGTGNPFFTTDTAAALRAVEISADILLKGTRVDGIYTSDPEKDTNAKKFEQISFDEAYNKGLKIMDLTAFALCKENALPIQVFDMNQKGTLLKVIEGKKPGTLVN